MTTLSELLDDSNVEVIERVGSRNPVVSSVEHDSGATKSGSVFCCVRGDHVDGHLFAGQAESAGAAAVIVDHRLPVAIDQVVVGDVRSSMGNLAAAICRHPSRDLTMVGVTGTNGKTTTTQLIAAVLSAAGIPTGVIGTLSGSHTTPESPELQRQLAAFRDDGHRAVAMEVSSHALALDRVVGTHFDVAVFTNLGRDHLDLHGTIERYFEAKARLFVPGLADRGVVNLDDLHGRFLADTAPIPMIGYSLADLSDVEITATSHRYRWRGADVSVAIGGAFNVANSLAAATVCAALGLAPVDIAEGLSSAPPVPGRFEPIDAGQDFAVIVDYAHTPDGLAGALRAARDACSDGRVIVVFGCGGDRDRSKRPQMGATAASGADIVVITSDNPRSEDPLAIINATVAGVPSDYRDRVVIEVDRAQAIERAVRLAAPGDVVLIAGKGHEQTQTSGATAIPFDDRLVARSTLERLA